MSKRGQVAVFVIIAIVLVGAVVAFFAITGRLTLGSDAGEFQPIFDRQALCIELATRGALELAGLQGGRIESGVYAPGSDYAPFSSHLNFLGSPIQYWYSLSANGLFKENVPTQSEIEREIEDFVAAELEGCDFSDFYEQGYTIERTAPEASVTILDSSVRVSVEQTFSAAREGSSASLARQNVQVDSDFGKFYTVAQALYAKQKTDAFLEGYAVDVLRSYAPVDGVFLTCAPKIWRTQQVVSDIREGLSANFGAIKFKGSYYTSTDDNSYFVVDQQTPVPVQLLYNPAWPSAIEVVPADDELMRANPVGNDPALGAMGFCYVPYHFVYDVRVPVLFQLYDGVTLFQFPVVAVVDNNLPRAGSSIGLAPADQPDVCAFRTAPATIKTFDRELNPVGATISYQCFDSLCEAGSTQIVGEDAVLETALPACVNGILHAQAEGYAERSVLFSSNSETSAELILDRMHEVQLELRSDGATLRESAVVQFVSADRSTSVAYPESSTVMLSEGLYNVTAYVYGNSSIVIPASSKTECQVVPKPGIAGLFGGTREQCFDITLPETRIDYALIGGGTVETYLLESDLVSGRLIVDIPRVPSPSSLEEAQYAFEAVQQARLEVFS